MAGLRLNAAAEELGILRAAVFGIWLFDVAPRSLGFWGELPRTLHTPTGPLELVPGAVLDRALEPEALDRAQRVLTGLLILSAAGVRPYRPIAGTTAALMTAHQSLIRGFTFVNHQEVAPLLVTYGLVLFPAADGFSVARRDGAPPEAYEAAMRAIALLLLIPYSQIGVRRFVRGRARVFTGSSVPYWYASLDALDRERRGIGRRLLPHRRVMATMKAGFLVTSLFEALAPLALVSRRFRHAWVAVIASLHLYNRLTLKLLFWENTAIIVLLLGGARRAARRLAARR